MTLFSKIIAGQIPCYKIAEDENFFAFLDIAPVQPGHTLVIPKMEVDKFFDLPEEVLAKMLVFAQPIAKALERTFHCNRCGISVVGLEVPHAHMHLIPINEVEDMSFAKARRQMSEAEFLRIQAQIIAAL